MMVDIAEIKKTLCEINLHVSRNVHSPRLSFLCALHACRMTLFTSYVNILDAQIVDLLQQSDIQ